MADVFVVGWPRSGNTWLSRLLADVINCPCGGMYNAAPLCAEGGERSRRHYVAQLHLKPTKEKLESVVPNAYRFSIPMWDNEPIVHIVRDPKDIAVSVKYYWDLRTIMDAINAMAFGKWPLSVHGPWSTYVDSWMDIPVYRVRYEDLHYAPDSILSGFFEFYDLEYDRSRVSGAIERQSFKEKKKQIEERDGNTRPYGATIQLKHMRRGKVGSWRREFTVEQLLFAQRHFGETAERLGYVF